MADHFLSVDLTPGKSAFEPLAIELGRPMLDPGQGNYRILRNWFKDLAAEPELSPDGQSVKFYVQQEGVRLLDVVGEPVATGDLDGKFAAQRKQMDEAFKQATPVTPGEQSLHRTVERLLGQRNNSGDPGRLPFSYFKYRDGKGQWRLVWCWGYQRRSSSPANAVICRSPGCKNLLFVQEAGTAGRCPRCAGAPEPIAQPAVAVAGVAWKRWLVVAALLLLLLGGVAFLVFPYLTRHAPPETTPGPQPPELARHAPPETNPPPKAPELVVTPEVWDGHVGNRVEFTVLRRENGEETNVGATCIARTDVPGVLELDRAGTAATATGEGKTVVHFYHGKMSTAVTVTVRPRIAPKKLLLEPESTAFGVHATCRVRVYGLYPDDRKMELAREEVDWEPSQHLLFRDHGLFEGLEAGNAWVRARYRGAPQDISATANLKVLRSDYQTLKLTVRPLPIPVGSFAVAEASAVDSSGREDSVLGSSRLTLTLKDPDDVVALSEGRLLHGRQRGKAQLTGTFLKSGDQKLSDEKWITVEGDGVDPSGGRDTPDSEQLLLTGPVGGQATVGARVPFTVELRRGKTIQPVTSKGAYLVLGSKTPNLAEAKSGCVVDVAKPGRLTVQARYGTLESEPLELTLVEQSTDFERLELDIQQQPLPVGGVRRYRILGYPKGSMAAQDITHRLGQPSGPVVEATSEPRGSAEHAPPRVTGKAKGTVTLQAKLSKLQSEPVTLDIVLVGDPLDLYFEPRNTTVHVNDSMPPVRVMAHYADVAEPCEVPAQLKSLNETTLAPDDKNPGGFKGVNQGRTALQASFRGKQAFLPVEVTDTFRFTSCSTRKATRMGAGFFTVEVDVRGQGMADQLEFRFKGGGDWKPEDGKKPIGAVLISPPIAWKSSVQKDRYELIIEARSHGKVVDTHRHQFEVDVLLVPKD